MTAPTQRPAPTSDARKRLAENTPAEPDADEREHLARVVYEASDFFHEDGVAYEDNHASQKRQAQRQASALLSLGYSRTPDAHLAAAWDEGVMAGRSTDVAAETQPTNPYRAARLREQGGE